MLPNEILAQVELKTSVMYRSFLVLRIPGFTMVFPFIWNPHESFPQPPCFFAANK